MNTLSRRRAIKLAASFAAAAPLLKSVASRPQPNSGDVVAISNGSAHAIGVEDSAATTFIDLKLFASPGTGILENAGPGGTTLQGVSVIPGHAQRTLRRIDWCPPTRTAHISSRSSAVR